MLKMKKLSIAAVLIVFLFTTTTAFAFSFRGISLDSPIDGQMKTCSPESKQVCYIKNTKYKYEVRNLSELNFQTNTTVNTYGGDNRIGRITVTFSGKDAAKIFMIISDNYGFLKPGRMGKKVIRDRNTGNRVIAHTTVWTFDDCLMILVDKDEDNQDKGILKINSRKYFQTLRKKTETRQRDIDKL
jgi:hypothetical protein